MKTLSDSSPPAPGQSLIEQYHATGFLVLREVFDRAEMAEMDAEAVMVAIFTGFTPHRSGPNLCHQWRRLLYLSYNKASGGGEPRTQHDAQFHRWLKDRYAEYGKTNTTFR